MEKKIKNKLLKAIILFIVMFASIGFKVSVKGFSHLNITSFTEEECYNYIINKGVSIPSFMETNEVKNIIYNTFCIVLNDPNRDFFYSCNETQEFVNNIKDIINKDFNSDSLNNHRSVSYALQDSTIYGGTVEREQWYNCYAFAINRYEKGRIYNDNQNQYEPGAFTDVPNDKFQNTTTIHELANIVRNDLLAIGMTNITISNSIPTINSNQRLICVRRGDADYHFMWYNQEEQSWLHKPGESLILRYNSTPSSNKVWTNEAYNGTDVISATEIYDSPIKYISYTENKVEIDFDTERIEYEKNIYKGKDVMLEMNIKETTSYKIIVSSEFPIEITYFNTIMETIPTIKFIKSEDKKSSYLIINLEEGKHYIDLKFIANSSAGFIKTIIEKIYHNEINKEFQLYNNNLPTHVAMNPNYCFNGEFTCNTTGLYKFTLSGNTLNETLTYNENSIKIYSDLNKNNLVNRISTSLYELDASTSTNANSLVVYLEQGITYYIDILLTDEDIMSLNLNIKRINETTTIDLNNYIEEDITTYNIFSNDISKGDNFEKISINQLSNITISFDYTGLQQEYIYFVLYKEVFSNTDSFLQLMFPESMVTFGESLTWNSVLEEGTYYIGYYNKLSDSPISISITQNINSYSSNSLVTDPETLSTSGSMVNVYEKNSLIKSYRGNKIEVGFTRIIYLDPSLNNLSRYDYNWYSSDEEVATVSFHGTILGISCGEVKIIAVYKNDPRIVYSKTFIVTNESNMNNETTININDIHNINNGIYQIGLTVQNSPYPRVLWYDWEIISYDESITYITIDVFGRVIIEGTGNVIIKGSNYIYNDKYSILINLEVME